MTTMQVFEVEADTRLQILPAGRTRAARLDGHTRSAAHGTPSWHRRAACSGTDPELFFPDARPNAKAVWQIHCARNVCRQCPVIDRCLRSALDAGAVHGIWGGLTEQERAELTGEDAKPGARTKALARAARTAAAAKIKETTTSMPASEPAAAAVRERTVPGALRRAAEAAGRSAYAPDIPMPQLPQALRRAVAVRVAPVAAGVRRALSLRELQLLELVAQGRSNKQIGEAVGISSLTVKTHKGRIADALGANGDAAHCVALGFARGDLRPDEHAPAGLPQLRPRQIELLILIAAGKSNIEIGAQLMHPEDTIKSRVRTLLKVLGVASRVAAVGFAFRNRLLEAELAPAGAR